MSVIVPPVRSLARGEVLIEQGEPAMDAYLIMDGQAEVFVNGKKIADVGEGEIVGETALFNGSDYGATVKAATDLSVQPIPPHVLDEKIKQCDPMLRALIRMLIVRLRKTNEALAGQK